MNKESKLSLILSIIVGILFSLCLVLGSQLQIYGESPRSLASFLIGFLIFLVLSFVFTFFFRFLLKKTTAIHEITPVINKKEDFLKVFIPCFLIIFILWIPVFLAYYPAIMSSDFDDQASQIVLGHSSFTNHHPFLSTLEIEFFLKIGESMGSPRKGVAALGLFHIGAVSIAISYLCVTIKRMLHKKWLPYIVAFLMALYPINPVMSLSTTKDVLFSAFFLLLVSLYINCLISEKKGPYFIFILLDIVLLASYRNNAIYALIPASIIMSLMNKGRKAKLTTILVCIFGVIVFELLQSGVSSYLGVTRETDDIEKHSVIIQTLGRTYANHPDDLEPESKEIIERLIPVDALNKYHPALSDPLKTPISRQTYSKYWKGQMSTVIKDWLHVGFKYPLDYLDAFLDLTRGYWYLNDNSFALVYGNNPEDRLGILYTYNSSGLYDMALLYHESKLPFLEKIYENLLSRNDCLKIPVLRLLFQLSTYLWILLSATVIVINRKDWKKLTVFIFPLLYTATLFLGPTAYVRYMFPIMLSTPAFLALLFSKINDK